MLLQFKVEVIKMPLGNDIGKFLFAIAEQTDGFSFGKPWRNSNMSLGLVIPILREKDVKRKYQMFEDSKDKIDIEDTGDVNIMRVVSKAGENVFIRSGVILEGGGQTRTVISGMVVMPNSEQDIDVKCVYASKPTSRGAKMKYADVAPPIVMQSLHDSQRDTWNAVGHYTTKHRSSARTAFVGMVSFDSAEEIGVSSSDDLLGTIREVEHSQKDVEGAIKDIPIQKNQVGAIIFDIDSIVGFEIFDSPKSWKALHKAVIKKYDEVLRKKQDKMLFELKPEIIPEKIAEFVEELCKADEKTTHSNEISKTIVIDGEKHIGEYTTIGADCIHVIAFKRENPKRRSNPSTTGRLQRNPPSQPRIIFSLEKEQKEESVLAEINWILGGHS